MANIDDFCKARKLTVELCKPLSPEDCLLQCSEEVSPPKWHLAHTTWFFENFILSKFKKNYRHYDESFSYLFNSYYETVGRYLKKPLRGTLSRPSLEQVVLYRNAVDEAILELFEHEHTQEMEELLILGIQHEQQHQELLLMDIKYNYWCTPSRPSYAALAGLEESSWEEASAPSYSNFQSLRIPEGIYQVGADIDGEGFAFDDEYPRHRVFLEEARLLPSLVTQGEYLEFILDHAYQNPKLWLSDGWNTLQELGWEAPLYWEKSSDGSWKIMSFFGMKDLQKNEPVSHLSFFEADAFARWAGKRLPTEQEWEIVASNFPVKGNFIEKRFLRPLPASSSVNTSSYQIFGDLWEWTQSPFIPYPKFRSWKGSLGEYNSKFMNGQWVLRGGSFATPESHIRSSYRNFYAPAARWQFCGLRLAEYCD